MKTIIKNNLISAGISILVAIFRVILLLWLLFHRNSIVYYTLFIIYCIIEFVVQFFAGRVYLDTNKMGIFAKCCSTITCILVNAALLSLHDIGGSVYSGFNVLEEYFFFEASRKVSLDIWYIAFCYLAITLGLLSKKERE